MAYSLRFNSRIIYYHTQKEGDGQKSPDERSRAITESMQLLMQRDEVQLGRDAKTLLANANCFSAKDKAFIYGVIDKNFDSRADMVNTIRAFIESTRSKDGSGRPGWRRQRSFASDGAHWQSVSSNLNLNQSGGFGAGAGDARSGSGLGRFSFSNSDRGTGISSGSRRGAMPNDNQTPLLDPDYEEARQESNVDREAGREEGAPPTRSEWSATRGG